MHLEEAQRELMPLQDIIVERRREAEIVRQELSLLNSDVDSCIAQRDAVAQSLDATIKAMEAKVCVWVKSYLKFTLSLSMSTDA